jgi:uncharacterized protein
MGRKHVPMRMCIACRQSLPKRGLVRVVRLSDGRVTLDPTGKQPGRGAYVCRRKACWHAALTKRSVEHALKTTLSDDEWAELVAFAGSIEESQEVCEDDASG